MINSYLSIVVVLHTMYSAGAAKPLGCYNGVVENIMSAEASKPQVV